MTENYKIPTLLTELGILTAEDIDDLHYGVQYYVLQICVPADYDAREVAREINKHTGLVTYCPEFFAGYRKAPRYVYIDVAKGAEASRIPEFRERINNTLYKVYGARLSGVEEFLRAIDACASGSKFALQYDSLWDVWNAMIDLEQWPYFGYVVNQILNDDIKDKLKPFTLVNIERIRNMQDFYDQTYASAPVDLTEVFTATYLKSLNPFMRPEGRSED